MMNRYVHDSKQAILRYKVIYSVDVLTYLKHEKHKNELITKQKYTQLFNQ